MPRFDFQCKKCNFIFEETRPFGSSDVPACPQCQGKTQKLIASPTILFKGGGFYRTDSKPQPVEAQEKKEKVPTKTEEKKPAESQQTKGEKDKKPDS